MSGRNAANDRELRARERERQRELQLIAQQMQRRQVVAAGEPNRNNAVANNNQGLNNNINGQPNAARPVQPRIVLAYQSTPGGTSVGVKRKLMNYGPDHVESWASSEIEQEVFAFLWTLKNFSAFQGSDEVKSPCFKGGPKSNHSWQLKMSPKKKVDDTEFFAVHLILASFGDNDNSASRKVKVRFQISLVDADGKSGKQAGSSTMNVCEFKKMSVWGYDKFIATSDLLNPVKRLVEDDVLRIHCRVWIEGELKHVTGIGGSARDIESPEEIKTRRLELLGKDLKTVMDSTVFADVALVTKSQSFLVHKCVLAARSTVFSAMFQSKMLESQQNTVEITDFEEDVVKAMIEYMYTGETAALNEKATDLIQIAEKYDLSGLKEDCEAAIAKNLTVENVAQVLVLAHLHSANRLKPTVIDFINRNKEEVRKTDSFNKVAQANPSVFVDLYLSQK